MFGKQILFHIGKKKRIQKKYLIFVKLGFHQK